MYYGYNSQEPLLNFSEHCERASFIDDDKPEEKSMSKKRRGVKRRKPRKGKRTRKLKGTKGLRFSKGRLSLSVSGFGVQKLSASELVRFIPLAKLKAAAKKVLRGKGTVKTSKRRHKGRKRKG